METVSLETISNFLTKNYNSKVAELAVTFIGDMFESEDVDGIDLEDCSRIFNKLLSEFGS
jgi:hypothetical protein